MKARRWELGSRENMGRLNQGFYRGNMEHQKCLFEEIRPEVCDERRRRTSDSYGQWDLNTSFSGTCHPHNIISIYIFLAI